MGVNGRTTAGRTTEKRKASAAYWRKHKNKTLTLINLLLFVLHCRSKQQIRETSEAMLKCGVFFV